ncbi:MAG: S46 family peptidase [Planctomycetota bacterium]
MSNRPPLTFARLFVFLVCLPLLGSAAIADEGMFPISELERLKLAEKGLLLSPGEIFSADKTCLVDGICRVNGCTGSFVSPNGLIITNHHCAYRAIQSASTLENDYLKNGFIPSKFGEEIPATGYTVRVTESFKDVSRQVLEVVQGEMSFSDRTKTISRRRKELEKIAESENPGKRAEVAEMFAGKTYVLFLYTYIKDVRLVFAPPSSVGNFGGDIDNWEWPRHTGDFSFMRAYVAPDGSTAEYAANNVPYRPKKFIQVSSAGANESDFVMLLGYPGRTARHKTASFLKYEQNVRLPYIVDLYGQQIETMNAAGANDRAVAIKLLSRIRSLANVEKRSRGQLKGLTRADIVAKRANEEAKLQSYIEADPARNSKYGRTLANINAAYQTQTKTAVAEANFQNIRLASQIMGIAFTIYDAAIERQKADLERESAYMDRNFDQTVRRMKLRWADLDFPTDQTLLTQVLNRYQQNGLGVEVPSIDSLDAMYDTTAFKEETTVDVHSVKLELP